MRTSSGRFLLVAIVLVVAETSRAEENPATDKEGVTADTRTAFVERVRPLLEKKDAKALEGLVNWDGSPKELHDISLWEVSTATQGEIDRIWISDFELRNLLTVVNNRPLKYHIPPKYSLHIKFKEGTTDADGRRLIDAQIELGIVKGQLMIPARIFDEEKK